MPAVGGGRALLTGELHYGISSRRKRKIKFIGGRLPMERREPRKGGAGFW